MNCTIPFSGFYESSHDSQLDDTLSQMFSDESGEPIDDIVSDAFDSIDWRIVHLAYAQAYCSALADECEATWKYVKLDSPREYNFRSDEIDVEIASDELQRMYSAVDKVDLAAMIERRLAPRSGFIPFYSNDVTQWGQLSKWESAQISLLVECYCNQYCDAESRAWELIDDCNGQITAMLESAIPADKLQSLYARAESAL